MSKTVVQSDNTDAESTTDTKEIPVVNPLSGLTPGRVVHLVWPDKTHVPAVVVAVVNDAGSCDLFAMPGRVGYGYPSFDFGSGMVYGVNFDASGAQIGSWHWIERTD